LFPHNVGWGRRTTLISLRGLARLRAQEVDAEGIDWTFLLRLCGSSLTADGVVPTRIGYSERPDMVREYSGRSLVQGLREPWIRPHSSMGNNILGHAKHFIGGMGQEHPASIGGKQPILRAGSAGYQWAGLSAAIQSVADVMSPTTVGKGSSYTASATCSPTCSRAHGIRWADRKVTGMASMRSGLLQKTGVRRPSTRGASPHHGARKGRTSAKYLAQVRAGDSPRGRGSTML